MEPEEQDIATIKDTEFPGFGEREAEIRRAVLKLMSHIEDTAPDDYWESIDTETWNAVTYLLME